ncbi:MAG: hypothetical protein NT080_00090 [Spirochaetes bacterium]|nr:hypothetical protein [Spirochaetota bacterium]
MARLIAPDSPLARVIESKRAYINASWDVSGVQDGFEGNREREQGRGMDLGTTLLMRFGSAASATLAAHVASVGERAAESAADAWIVPLFRSLLALAATGRLETGHADALAAACASAPALLSADPDAFTGTVARGYSSLRMRSGGQGGAADRWIRILCRAAAFCPDITAFRNSGCVAAWLTGLVEYRAEGLRLARGLGTETCTALFGVPLDDGLLEGGIDALARDPWLSPARAFTHPVPGGRVTWFGSAGGHESTGGCFAGNPSVRAEDGRIVIIDGGAAEGAPERERLLVACPEGVSLVPRDTDSARFPGGPIDTAAFRIAGFSPDGLPLGSAKLEPVAGCMPVPGFERLGPFSAAGVGSTLALVSVSSFRVFVIGIEGER